MTANLLLPRPVFVEEEIRQPPVDSVGQWNFCHHEETGAQQCRGSCLETRQDFHPLTFWLRPPESLRKAPGWFSLGHWQKGTSCGASLRCPEGNGAVGLPGVPAELEGTVSLGSDQTQNSVSTRMCLGLDL